MFEFFICQIGLEMIWTWALGSDSFMGKDIEKAHIGLQFAAAFIFKGRIIIFLVFF